MATVEEIRRDIEKTKEKISAQQNLVAAVALARIVADEFDHPFARRPRLLTQRVMVAELFLRPDLVFQGTPLEAVGYGW